MNSAGWARSQQRYTTSFTTLLSTMSMKQRQQRQQTQSRIPFYLRQVSPVRGVIYVLTAILALVAVFWVITGDGWRAVALSVASLFGLLFALALYFWGTMLIGGTLASLVRRQSPVPWALDDAGLDIPEHDLDPGLELLGAGLLVYRTGEVRPTVHFRDVPLNEARAVRPFVVARTGAARPHSFFFALEDEDHIARFDQQFTHELHTRPQLVMPHCLLTFPAAQRMFGQRWTLHVRCGVTVVTSLRFTFVNGRTTDRALPGDDGFSARSAQVRDARTGNVDVERGDDLAAWQQQVLPRLLDEAIKRDALSLVPQVVVED